MVSARRRIIWACCDGQNTRNRARRHRHSEAVACCTFVKAERRVTSLGTTADSRNRPEAVRRHCRLSGVQCAIRATIVLFFPPYIVHTHHEEPQRQRPLSDDAWDNDVRKENPVAEWRP